MACDFNTSTATAAIEEPALLRFEYREGPHGMHNAGGRAIFEDGGGNVWFGTHLDGLARFDGREFAGEAVAVVVLVGLVLVGG